MLASASTSASAMTARREPLTRARWLAWGGVLLYIVLAGASIALQILQEGRSGFLDIWLAFAVLAYAVIGALIVSRRPRHTIGWMFTAAALSLAFNSFARQYAVQALVVAPGTLPFGVAMSWFGFWTEIPAIAVIAFFLPLLFPDGHLPSRRWRPAAYAAAGFALLATILEMVGPATYAPLYPSIANPIGLNEYQSVFDATWPAIQVVLFAMIVTCALALFARLRNADADERQQLKWFGFAGALVVVSFAFNPISKLDPSFIPAFDLLIIVAITALPTAVGIAILRHRLYDIDLIINRTVVYVALTAVLAGIYTGAIALFQRMFVAMTGQGSDLAIVMTLFVLATVFTPIKNALQENVDRRIKPAKPAGPRSATVDDLIMLAELHKNGVLTDEEFAAKKKQALGI